MDNVGKAKHGAQGMDEDWRSVGRYKSEDNSGEEINKRRMKDGVLVQSQGTILS